MKPRAPRPTPTRPTTPWVPILASLAVTPLCLLLAYTDWGRLGSEGALEMFSALPWLSLTLVLAAFSVLFGLAARHWKLGAREVFPTLFVAYALIVVPMTVLFVAPGTTGPQSAGSTRLGVALLPLSLLHAAVVAVLGNYSPKPLGSR
jgi:hypothetical protein